MHLQNIIKTIVAKSGILVLNFVIVVLTTQFWGAEGRGIISLLIANLTIIVTINNVLSGSSIAFHISSYSAKSLFKPSVYWIFACTLIACVIIYLIQGSYNLIYLFILTVFTSLTNFNLSVFLGKEKINYYNNYSFVIPLLTLVLFAGLYYFGINISLNAYFIGYLSAYGIIWVLSLKNAFTIGGSINQTVDKPVITKIFNYGWKNELSYFLQFLNYRFSYFIILHYLGYKTLGVFSIGIALAESVWIISNSISVVHYSKVLNSGDKKQMIALSNKSALISLVVTLGIGVVLILVPANWFGFIFGKDFTPVKPLLLMLYPGILFIAFSNIYGHYLSATGQMRPLIIKSILGLAATISLTLILIPGMGLTGACISTVVSHLISSAYICWAFFRNNSH